MTVNEYIAAVRDQSHDPFECDCQSSEECHSKESRRSVVPGIVCADGFRLSVQGGVGKHSHPDNNAGPYLACEVMVYAREWTPPEDWKEYLDHAWEAQALFGWVPVRLIDALIAEHGGIKPIWN